MSRDPKNYPCDCVVPKITLGTSKYCIYWNKVARCQCALPPMVLSCEEIDCSVFIFTLGAEPTLPIGKVGASLDCTSVGGAGTVCLTGLLARSRGAAGAGLLSVPPGQSPRTPGITFIPPCVQSPWVHTMNFHTGAALGAVSMEDTTGSDLPWSREPMKQTMQPPRSVHSAAREGA